MYVIRNVGIGYVYGHIRYHLLNVGVDSLGAGLGSGDSIRFRSRFRVYVYIV